MAIVLLVFCIPSITKNVFTMLSHSPILKIFSTIISDSTHYEYQEALLRVVQVFDTNAG
jgi:hypothetical protein